MNRPPSGRSPSGRPPSGRPSLPPEATQRLLDNVAAKYGSFGARPPEENVDRRVLADHFLKPTLQIIAGVFLATIFASIISHPSWSAPDVWANSFRLDSALVIIWGPLLWWAMSRLRIWKSVRIYLVLSLTIESFSESMFRDLGLAEGGGYWNTVMWPAAVAWYGTLKEFAGIPGVSLSTFFFVTVFLLYRAVYGKKDENYAPPPKFAHRALLVFLCTIAGLAALGIARGGGTEWAFRQTIHLLQLSLVAMLFLYALRIPDDLAAVGTAFVAAAVARSLLVFYVYFGVCMPAGITKLPGKPEWCTNHSDTVLFVSALMILISHALEQRNRKVILRSLGLGAVILLGIILNNRRLAFVSLSAAPLAMYFALRPSKRKRRVTIALAVLVPLLVGYVLVGSEINSPSPLLKPAKLVVSVMDQKDASSQSREIENENLVFTLSKAPLVPTGFGHEYQYSPNNPPVDLGYLFGNYLLIAHNGVLWIWSLAGVVGFSLLWFLYPLAGTFALRSYRSASSHLERSAALASFAIVVVVIVQIWGDQGFNSYMTLLTFAVAFAVAARLAARVA